ncbi:MAG: FeoC-like transcriptional regulator [Anaerolineae bacterium]|jgi:DNA-binding Lrp family transcriptional regulator
MLDRLLELLREGGTRPIRSIAEELDTTPELVRAMLEDLERMGHLRRLRAECEARCSTCSVSAGCVARYASHDDGIDQGMMGWVLADTRKAR